MPNQPKTPAVTYRIPVDLRAKVKERALKEGVTESDIVRAALTAYVSPK